MGVPTVLLIAFSFHFRKHRPVQFLMILAAVSYILALGGHTPIYWVLWKLMPGMNLVRVPARFLLLFIFCCALLAGFGLKYLLSSMEARTLNKATKVSLFMALGGACIALVMMIARSPLIDWFTGTVVRNLSASKAAIAFDNVAIDLIVMSMLLVITSVALLYKRRRNMKGLDGRRNSILASMMIGAIVVNLGIAHISLVDTKDPSAVYKQPDHIVYLSMNAGDSRIYDPENLITDNYQIVYGIKTLEGYNPLMIEDYAEVMVPLERANANYTHPLLDLLNVKYVLTRCELNGTDLKLVFNDTQVFVYENDDALGYGFIVHNAVRMNKTQSLDTLKNVSFDPKKTVIVSELPDGYENVTDPGTDNLTILYKGLNEIGFRVNMTESGFLVLSETYYPDCNVYIDGVREKPLKVDYTLTGVYLEAGKHDVRFVHELII
jgi:hypothetical protein